MSEIDPTNTTDASEVSAPDAPARKTTRRRAKTAPADAAATADSDTTSSGSAPAPRKRAPRKTAARKPPVSDDQAPPEAIEPSEELAIPDVSVTDSPAPASRSRRRPVKAATAVEAPAQEVLTDAIPSGDPADESPIAAQPVQVEQPVEVVAAAPPARRQAPAGSGFALLAQAGPLFSSSATQVPPPPAPPVPAADTDSGRAVTPESLLAALDTFRSPFTPPVVAAPTPAPEPPLAGETGTAEEDDEADEADDIQGADDNEGTDDTGSTGEPAAAADPESTGRRRRRRGGRRRRGSDRSAGEAEPAATADTGEGAAPDGPQLGEESSDSTEPPARARRQIRIASDSRIARDIPAGRGTTAPTAPAADGGTSQALQAPDIEPTDNEPTDNEPTDTEPTTQPAVQPAAADESADEASPATLVEGADEAGLEDDATDQADGEAGASTRRRRRRRRRGGEEAEPEVPAADDPPDTVVRVREPRRRRSATAKAAETAEPEITAARGSTRIEAKRQRRRDGHEARKRPPILTEAEFLTRRESVARTMLVREKNGRTQIGVLEDGLLVEHYVAEEAEPADRSLIGDVYLGRVQNVLPAMEAAFIDIGRGRNAVLYAGEVDWDGLGMEGKPKRIELALKSGQSILVQVTKDPIGQKGARLTAQVSLAGRYLVLVPNGAMSGISRKLPDIERARLKKILKELLPPKAGVIVRTAAEGASEAELASDVERLTGQWDAISAQTATATAPAMLQGEPDLTIKVVRDIFNEDFTSLVVSGPVLLGEVRSYVGSVAPSLLDRVSAWTGEQDIFTAHRVDEQLVKALDRKVFLPSGGSLVIDRTEAMTVVDVNTGRFTGSGGNLEETVTENNLEAAEEIVRQLRLRDIGGIIVVDFIDMVFEANRDLVIRRLVECLGRDRTRHQVAEVSSLGLVQMTRKRIGRGLLEVFGRPCESCKGRGMVVDLDGLAGHGEDHHHAERPVEETRAPRIPNPGNTGRAHLRTIVDAIPVGDVAREEATAEVPSDLAEVTAAFDAPEGLDTIDEIEDIEELEAVEELEAAEGIDAVAAIEAIEGDGGPGPVEAGIEGELEAEDDLEMEAVVERELESERELDAEVDPETPADPEFDLPAGAELQIEPGVQTDPDVEDEPGVRADLDADLARGVRLQDDQETEFVPESQPV